VEAHETTKERSADQETPVRMAGPYTAETDRYNQTCLRVEPPRQTEEREAEEHVAKSGAWRG
jgi:hypothetical protein